MIPGTERARRRKGPGTMTALSPHLRQATPVVAERGEGRHLYGKDGRRYLDFTAGIGVTSTGHCHPKVVAAAQEQVGTLIHGQYTTVMHQPLRQLVDKLGEVLPAGLDSLFFTNSGSEAVEAALRLARQATGRPNVLVCHGGFHGRTVAAASMTTSGTRFRSGFSPLMSGRGRHPVPDGLPLRLGRGDRDPFRPEGARLHCSRRSPRPPTRPRSSSSRCSARAATCPRHRAFLEGLRERADRHGFLLILDEVQTGVGPHRPLLGPRPLRRHARHPRHRQGPGQRLPAVRHRGLRGADGQGVAGLAGRHLRRQRGRVRGGLRHPRRRTRREARRERRGDGRSGCGRAWRRSPTGPRPSATCAASA